MTYQPAAPSAPTPPAPLPPKTRFGGLAWAGLILGIIGIVGSPIIILNNVTAVVAGVGVVLGVIALFGTRKVVAAIGVALCVAGIVITVVVQNAAVKSLDNAISTVTGPAAGATHTNTWGQRYTWSNGLAVEVAAPAACTPSDAASPSNVARAVKFTVTVVNGTQQSFDASELSFGSEAQFNGQTAQSVIDLDGPCGDGGTQAATVLPGKTYTYVVSYAVTAQPGDMQLVFQPSFGSDKAVFTGKA